MEHDVASGQMYAYTEIPTTSPLGYRRERLIIPLGLWSFPVDEKPIFPFFVDWALQGGASKPRPSNFLSTGIVDWAGWYLVLSTGLAGSYSHSLKNQFLILTGMWGAVGICGEGN